MSYIGFSTYGWAKLGNHTFKTGTIDTIKTDLYNHIYTRLGERLHMPSFGTRIPDLTFEILDDHTLGIIREDLNKVFEYDPRVKVRAMEVTGYPDLNTAVAIVDLIYVEYQTTENLRLEFNGKG